jgi:tricarballylate dehydrogenase
MFRVTRYRTQGDLCERLVTKSYEAALWLRDKGMRFQPIWGRQAYKIDGKFKFWGGLTVEAWGGGPGLVEQHVAIARKRGIEIRYGARALSLIYDGHAVTGVRVKQKGAIYDLNAKSVVLACGGFESNPEWRTRYLGPGWELAKVRGTRFNSGDGIRMAIDIGASTFGNWSGCHAVGWDYNAPEFGDLSVGDNFQKHSYPWGIMVNATGRRFVDEGADFRNYTYAKYGRVILNQPDQFAWQVFDKKIIPMLRDEYRIKRVTKVTASTLEEFAAKLEGVDPKGFLDEIKRYNAAVRTDVPFNPNIKDGRSTQGLEIDKTNWANTIEEPPFEAYQVTCGVTFTFGGLRIVPETAQVVDSDMDPIPGLYAAGELVGGLFYFNYPGGTGLTSGSVFGRTAGEAAGDAAKLRR